MADNSQGLLARILSAGNVAKRDIKDFVSNPGDYWDKTLGVIKESQVTPEQAQEMALNFVAPGVGGIIAGPKFAAALGLDEITRKATEMFAKGVSNHLISQRTASELASMRNPGQAMSVFIGPDKIPRLVVGNQASKIVSGKQDVFRDIATPLFGEKGVPLSDVLLHPSLYEGSELANKMTVRVNKQLAPNTAQYVVKNNSIEFGSEFNVPNALRNDPEEYLAQVLRHEVGHGLQIEEGMRRGSAPDSASLLCSVEEALSKGSFKSADELNAMKEKLVTSSDAEYAFLADIINSERNWNDYMRNYGEWEAEFGAKMNPNAFPMSYERKKTW